MPERTAFPRYRCRPGAGAEFADRLEVLCVLGGPETRAHGPLRVVLVGGGDPKIPTTASPMNFSTTPPYAWIRARVIDAYADSIRSTSSGSADSAVAVKPTKCGRGR